MTRMLIGLAVLTAIPGLSLGQVTTGEILGTVLDPTGAALEGAGASVRSLETNAVRKLTTDAEGGFRFPQLPVGAYELAVEKSGFARYVQGPVVLRLNQNASLEIQLQLATVTDRVTVTDDAPLLNSNNAEIGVNFDRKRVSELPMATDRNVLKLALSVAGVSQLQAGQSTALSNSLSFSVNGARVRSNNFMIDGQNVNASLLTGTGQGLNNPDIVAEFRLITNQFAPEYGRFSGSVVNIITKSGTNRLHGSAFWFHNDNHLNAPTNLDLAVPFRIENQFGGTLGGPVVKNKTFFFGSLQRWTDRQKGGGKSFIGAPTQEGRELLQSIAGSRPTVKILLEHLPAAQVPAPGKFAPVTVEGRSALIPLGSLSGSSNISSNDWQWSGRLDHRLNDRHTLGGRYLFNGSEIAGAGQVTPPGLTTVMSPRPQIASVFLNSSLSPTIFYEMRVSYQRFVGSSTAVNPAAERIPSILVNELGLSGNAATPARTAIGLAANLPLNSFNHRYQFQSTLGVQRARHSLKFGVDFQRDEVNQLSQTFLRGSLTYTTLQGLVDDVAQSGQINTPLPGGSARTYTRQYDYAFFVQDEWRVRPNLGLTYGIRYEAPGNPVESLSRTADRIVAANRGDQRFALTPKAPRDANNWAPRFGFNYRFGEAPGILRGLTGDRALVLRGGYARTYDFTYLLVVGPVANSFPFVKSDAWSTPTPNALEFLRTSASTPFAGNPNLLGLDVPPADLRSPLAEQFALQLQREFSKDWLLSIGYVATKGTALFQQIDLNPTIPGSRGTQRLYPAVGIRRSRCNCTSSIYHSLQTSLEKRLSREFSMAAHYTWSSFIDGTSDVLNTAPSGDTQMAQDSYNRNGDRARSSFDRPHRVAVNGVFELPFLRGQKGAAGRVLGGWQVSGFLTLQSGAPFTVTNGADPGSLGTGAIRANVNTSLDLARMSVEEIYRAGAGRLFSPVTTASPLGNIGRHVLRSDGIGNLDLGLIKNTKLAESHNLQFRAELYNATNTRNFGIPTGIFSSTDFLNQWGSDGGNRRIVMALRYVF